MLGISSAILAAEVVGGLLAGSLALLADAGHMLSDVAGLGLALSAAVLAARPATDTRTWGYLRAEVLAAAAQAAVLLAVGGFVLAEAVRRLILWGSITRSRLECSVTGSGLGGLLSWDHRWVIFSVGYLLARCLLSCLAVLARRELSKDAELLVLRHENAVLRRQVSQVRYQPAYWLWLTALSKLIPAAGRARYSL